MTLSRLKSAEVSIIHRYRVEVEEEEVEYPHLWTLSAPFRRLSASVEKKEMKEDCVSY